MSHITTIALKILDLQALKAAVKEFGCEWIEGKTEYKWYGRYMGDTKLPEGITVDQLGKCSHVIKVPGVSYEIGVVKVAQGGYTLAYDYYNHPSCGHDGGKLLEKFGEGLKGLVQRYAVCKTTIEAKAKGWMCARQTMANGTIRLTLSGV